MYLLVFVGFHHVTVDFCWVPSCICWFLLGCIMYLLVFIGLHHVSVGFCWVTTCICLFLGLHLLLQVCQ